MASLLQPGTHSDTASTTMAKQIEAAFINQWPHFNPELPLPEGAQMKSLRLFFVAVAQGVIQHLRDNPQAFEVRVNDSGSDLQGTVVEVNTTGTTS
jgi:hypothetical protein